MHVGVALFATDWTSDVRGVARAAEDAGFESMFVAEHTHIPVSRETPHPAGGELPPEYARTLDPFVALTAAATVTDRLRVGTGVCLVGEHDPITLAKTVATLDVLSGGRLLLGVGAGWNAEELADHGVPFGQRWQVLQQRVELMQALWTHEEASYDAEHARVSASWQWPKPVQAPLPVLVGGGGERAMRHAVAYGTGWMPMPTPQPLGERLTRLRELAAAAGRDAPEVTMYAVRADRAVLDHYAAAGVARCVLMLPPRGDTVAAVQALAATVLR